MRYCIPTLDLKHCEYYWVCSLGYIHAVNYLIIQQLLVVHQDNKGSTCIITSSIV